MKTKKELFDEYLKIAQSHNVSNKQPYFELWLKWKHLKYMEQEEEKNEVEIKVEEN